MRNDLVFQEHLPSHRNCHRLQHFSAARRVQSRYVIHLNVAPLPQFLDGRLIQFLIPCERLQRFFVSHTCFHSLMNQQTEDDDTCHCQCTRRLDGRALGPARKSNAPHATAKLESTYATSAFLQ